MIHKLDYTGIDLNWDDQAGTLTSVKSPSYAQKLQQNLKELFSEGEIPPAPERPYSVHIKNDPLKNAPEFLACLCAGKIDSQKRWNWWKLPTTLNWDMVKPLIEMLPEEDFDPTAIY